MCNYTIPDNYKPNDLIKFCNYYELINSFTSNILDELDEDEKCIFHSNHIQWKRNNNFHELLFILLKIYRDTDRNVNFSGVHFIAKDNDSAIDYITNLLPCNFHGAVFLDHIEISNQEINQPVNLEYCNFRSDVLFKKCNFKNGVIFSNMDFYCETTGTFELKNCIFKSSVDFCNTNIKGSLSIIECRFMNPFVFLDNTLTQDGLFEVTATFEDYTIFGNLNVFSTLVNFGGCIFNGETIFSNNKIQAEQQIRFDDVNVNKTLLFSGKDDNRIFHSYTRFPVKAESIKGKITFQHTNLSNIDEEDRQEILRLQSSGKIIIERGCIKYRLQTKEKIIIISANNQVLIDEITRTYTNFFISNTGYNLGIEIIERTSEKITFFYFSDENISEQEFINLLENSSKSFLGLFLNFKELLANENNNYFINGVMGLISLVSISLKVSLLIAAGQWKQENTNALINSIHSSNETKLYSKSLTPALSNINLPETLKNIIESNSLNMITYNQVNQNGGKNVYIENNNLNK